MPMAALLLIGAAVGGGVVWMAERGAAPMPERAQIEGVVRDYVLSHPEIIPAAMQRLQERETGAAVAANRAAVVRPFGNAWIGNPQGDVTLVEYYDYNCGYCRASLPIIRQLVAADPKLRIVFRELPVLSEASRVAARLSLAAAEQGRFPAFHDALFAGGRVSEASMAAAARQAGVNVALAARSNARYDAILRANLDVAARLGINGTPAWVVGNRVLAGALPLEEMQRIVAEARRH